MTSWLFGGSDALPARIEPLKLGKDVHLDIFVDAAVTKIYNEASARSKDQRAVKVACKKLIDAMRSEDPVAAFQLRVPLNPAHVALLLEPLRLACAQDAPKLQEPALGCLHKLVAHTYLQGESSHAGKLDEATTVAQVTMMASKCGEGGAEGLQLAVIRALLTFSTADHFVLHGDCLMQAVRTVFNVAIGSDSVQIRRTAENALLQMLNTVLKRVTQGIHYFRGSSLSLSSATSMMSPHSQPPSPGGTDVRSHPAHTPQQPLPPPAAAGGDSLRPHTPQVLEVQIADAVRQGEEGGGAAPGQQQGGSKSEAANGSTPYANGHHHHTHSTASAAEEGGPASDSPFRGSCDAPGLNGLRPAGDVGPAPLAGGEVPPRAASRMPPAGSEHMVSAEMHAATLASLAEQVDIRGIERALEKEGGLESPGDLAKAAAAAAAAASGGAAAGGGRPGLSGSPGPTAPPSVAGGGGSPGAPVVGSPGAGPAFDQEGLTSGAGTPASSSQPPSGGKDARRAIMRDRQARWRHLSVLERDVLLVLNAICKMAAREGSGSSADGVLLNGKLLALDLLVKVLSNPLHHWETVRSEFSEQLRQPLCLALLRNCTSSNGEVYGSSTRLLGILLRTPKLRAGLKAELGALVPLLLLRPVEAERPDALQLLPALEAVAGLASDPQLLVDLFVNYDCSLQAANLYERTCKGLHRVAKGLDPGPQLTAQQAAAARDVAVAAVQACVASLDTWAAPLKDAALAAAAAAEDASVPGSGPSAASATGAGAVPPSTAALLAASMDGSPFKSVGSGGLGSGGLGSFSMAAGGGGDASEVAIFGAAKEKKDSLQAAISLFNRKPMKGVAQLQSSGLVPAEGGPQAVARFLREHLAELDKGMIGEYLGHHEAKEVEVMHAYIDLDRYNGQTIDEALRQLLGTFRLPGESQKIDRIMEKFAERYCRDNPEVFRNAGDAYVLAFAIIMLNTDAHNPMAEQRLSSEDFVNMNQTQVESGDYEPILPRAEIESIFRRITEREIQVDLPAGGAAAPSPGAAKPPGSSGAKGGPGGAPGLLKLAASLGMTQLMLPFRGSGAVWDKQHGVDVERRWLLEKTRELVAKGGTTGVIWHTATHSEHARPMMQVSGDCMVRSLVSALAQAQDMASAETVLETMTQSIRLAGILGLQQLMEGMLGALAAETGVSSPAAQGSLAESKQTAALRTLLALAAGPDGALLGASWLTVLRVASQLQALQQALVIRPGSTTAGAAAPAGVAAAATHLATSAAGVVGDGEEGELSRMAPYRRRILAQKARRNGLHQQGGMSRLLTQVQAGSAPGLEEGEPYSPESASQAPEVADGPGHGLVAWSVSPAGESLVDALYLRCCGLDGDSVVAFMRSLCAVSQEELTPEGEGAQPRLYSLQQLVECAVLNTGRIRLVLNRLWAVVAPHLVSAACAPHPGVARFALRRGLLRLVDRLLLRAELANFTYQDEALRPFAVIMRHCDGPGVRECAVRCIADAITAHPRSLGSGWRSLLQALTIAAGDESSAVVNQSLDAMQPVLEALYRAPPLGHCYLQESLAAVMAAVRNQQQEELSTGALYMFQSIARRLAAATGCAGEAGAASAMGAAGSRSDGGAWASTSGDAAGGGDAFSRALAAQQQQQQSPGASPRTLDTGASPSNRSPSAGGRQPQRGVGHGRGSIGGGAGGQPPSDEAECWLLLLGTLAASARLDPRPKVADAAAQVLFDIVKEYSAPWEPRLFKLLLERSALALLDLPAGPRSAAESAAAAAAPSGSASPAGGNSSGYYYAPDTPSGASTSAGNGTGGGGGGGSSAQYEYTPFQRHELSQEGPSRVERQARRFMRVLWEVAAEQYPTRGPACLRPLLGLAVRYVMQQQGGGGGGGGQPSAAGGSSAAFLGVVQLQGAADALGGVLDAAGWQEVVRALSVASATDHLLSLFDPSRPASTSEARYVEDAVRCRCALVVCCQRLLAEVAGGWQHTMPPEVQLQVLGILKDTVDRAIEFNTDERRRRAALPFLSSTRGGGGGAGPRSWRGSSGGLVASPSSGDLGHLSLAAGGGGGAPDMTPTHGGSGGLAAAAGAGLLPRPGTPISAEQAHEMDQSLEHISSSGDLRSMHLQQQQQQREQGSVVQQQAVSPDALRPALLRQEVEGGLLLVQALVQLTQTQAADPARAGGPLHRQAQRMLLDVCHCCVSTAARGVTAMEPGSSGGPVAALEGGGSSYSPCWDASIRAPLTVAALRAYQAIDPATLRADLGGPRVFGDLTSLVRSRDPTVKQQVAQVFEQCVLPLVAPGAAKQQQQPTAAEHAAAQQHGDLVQLDTLSGVGGSTARTDSKQQVDKDAALVDPRS